MLPNNLVTNEIKDSAGAEVEFNRFATAERKLTFQKKNCEPANPHQCSIAHQVIGTGIKAVRRSAYRVDITSTSEVDLVTPVTTSVYTVVSAPVGHMKTLTVVTNALAYLMSGLASTGADTTIKFDGTGTFASSLINGDL